MSEFVYKRPIVVGVFVDKERAPAIVACLLWRVGNESASKFISFVLGLLKIDRRSMYSVL